MFSLSLGFWLDIVCLVFLCGICVVFIYFDNGIVHYYKNLKHILKINTIHKFVENTSSSNIGLAISQTLILLGMLQFGVKMTSETLVQMIAVERMIHYTNIEGEQDSIYSDKCNKINTKFMHFQYK